MNLSMTPSVLPLNTEEILAFLKVEYLSPSLVPRVNEQLYLQGRTFKVVGYLMPGWRHGAERALLVVEVVAGVAQL